ncbi:hypothetical protein SS50377_22925 [Spironucleus salmonicida]|uniref:Uncharacterized protein n=1 Tax=Spironucleus salmonicida TaxID=348837 RepID=V6LW29_9EUKA|nr:hypothetical protein SS50377_22925 [Spironucleus salmonicida]|eukprot:EST48770.1 Hypothetical protein SS50377_11094 [Spironucleus salmonicida]
MNAQQKEQFLSEIRQVVNVPDHQLLSALTNLPNDERYGIWTQISRRIGVSQRMTADYFHNTWSKQFFKRPHQYKNEIRELLQEALHQEGTTTAVESVMGCMAQRHGNAFHKQELRTYIKRQAGKRPEFTGLQIEGLLLALANAY